MSSQQLKWRKGTVKFITEQKNNLIEYGNSTRGCDTIYPGEVREVYFESFQDRELVGHIIHISYLDSIWVKDEDIEIISLGELETMHPTQRMLKQFTKNTENLVENIINESN